MQKIRLSHSSLDLLNSCERKFQLEKLLAAERDERQEPHLIGGTAYGVGCASYLVHQDVNKAIYEGWMAYWPIIETDKRNQAKYLNAMWRTFPVLDDLLQDYEIVYFHGKPAIELSFRMEIDENFYFVGYIDAVLRNKNTGIYIVLDFKHTGLEAESLDPVYKHSPQLLGYSIAIDTIVGEELAAYGVLYVVAQLGRGYDPKIHVLSYDKTILDRLNFFLTLKMDVMRIEQMQELGVFPKRHTACFAYRKPCFHFGTCHLHSMDNFVGKPEEDTKTYDFNFDLDTLIENHIARIQS